MFSKKLKREAFWPGNYPKQVWPRVRELLSDDVPDSYFRFVREEEKLRKADSPYFILADIEGFSDFCKSHKENPDAMIDLLVSFFGLAGNQIHLNEGEVLKFIGDAVFAMAPDKDSARRIAESLLTLYDAQITKVEKFGTGVVIVVSKPEYVLKGFVGGGGAYVDYSYWSPDLNSMFHESKQNDHVKSGTVYFVGVDGFARPWA